MISPGPVTTAIISQSTRSGWKVGPLVSAGHAVLELLMVAAIAFGLSAGLAHPTIQTAIAFGGGALLVWMGAGMAIGAARGSLTLPGPLATGEAMSSNRMIAVGMFATVTNPFWYAWWVTVAAGYLAQARALGAASLAMFYLGHIGADFGWNTTLSAVFGGGRRWINARVYRAILGACGLFLAYLGVTFFLHGIALL